MFLGTFSPSRVFIRLKRRLDDCWTLPRAEIPQREGPPLLLHANYDLLVNKQLHFIELMA